MSTKVLDWADDEGSSDEESVDEQPQNNTPVEETVTKESAPQQERDSAPPPPKQRQQYKSIPDRAPFLAYVGNLKYTVTRDAVGNFFHNGGCKVKDVRMQLKDDGQSRGSAIVEFEDKKSLERALEANDVEFEGRRLNVALSDRNNRRDKNRGKGRDRDRDDRGERRGPKGGPDSREEWSRKEQRGGNGNKNSRNAPPLPNPSSTDAPPTRKKLELKPRQAPIDTIGERVAQSSIFGEGKAREENLALNSVTKDVKELNVDAKTNKDKGAPKDTKNETATSGDNTDKKKKSDQKTWKDNKDKNARDKKKDKDRKGDKKGNTPKSQDRKNTNGDGKSKSKAQKAKTKEQDASEEASHARFVAANEKLMKPTTTAPVVKKVNTFSALMSDESDSDSN